MHKCLDRADGGIIARFAWIFNCMICYTQCMNDGDYFSAGIYLSSGKILIVAAIVVFMIIGAYWLGKNSEHDKDSGLF